MMFGNLQIYHLVDKPLRPNGSIELKPMYMVHQHIWKLDLLLKGSNNKKDGILKKLMP
jgi:hypothetical protein